MCTTRPARETATRHLPQLLDAERVELRQTPGIERKPLHERLGQIAANAVTENRDLRVQIDAGLERGLVTALLVESAIPCAHADDAVTVVEHRGRRETREQIDAGALGLVGQPLDEAVDRHDLATVIRQRRRGEG